MSTFTISRIAIALTWFYHGIVPKLVFCHPSEIELVKNGPVLHSPETMIMLAGIGEILLGITVLVFWKHSWPVIVSIGAFVFLLFGAMTLKPAVATEAFNPVSLSMAIIALGWINLASNRNMCKREE